MRRIGNVLQPLLAEIDELGGDRSMRSQVPIWGDAILLWRYPKMDDGCGSRVADADRGSRYRHRAADELQSNYAGSCP
jgi:hypothetical protein